MYRRFWKRVFDLCIAFIVLALAFPVLLVVSLVLYFSNDGKPFFFQTRPGKNEKLFRILKFKTMNDKRDAHGNLLPDAERLTAVGSFVRKTSLDELPQFINVLKGDMSIVGPRPLLVQYLPLYTPQQRRRHLVKPGITGWAQVNGRNTISWEEKFEYDQWYVQNLSFWLDMKIMFLTAKNVIRSENISSNNHATMPYFKGSNQS